MSPDQRAMAEKADRQGDGRWSHAEMLLAMIVDALHVNTWATGSWKKTPPYPKPIPRPGVDDKRAQRYSTIEELKAHADPRALAIAEAMRNRQPLPD